jgi:hypothetical protein
MPPPPPHQMSAHAEAARPALTFPRSMLRPGRLVWAKVGGCPAAAGAHFNTRARAAAAAAAAAAGRAGTTAVVLHHCQPGPDPCHCCRPCAPSPLPCSPCWLVRRIHPSPPTPWLPGCPARWRGTTGGRRASCAAARCPRRWGPRRAAPPAATPTCLWCSSQPQVGPAAGRRCSPLLAAGCAVLAARCCLRLGGPPTCPCPPALPCPARRHPGRGGRATGHAGRPDRRQHARPEAG